MFKLAPFLSLADLSISMKTLNLSSLEYMDLIPIQKEPNFGRNWLQLEGYGQSNG